MSKERELLKKLLDSITELDDRQGLGPLTCEIEELLAQPEQEPAAWIATGFGGGTVVNWYDKDIIDLPKGTKLYTTPPKREPLSDEQLAVLWFERAIEKAHGIGVDDER